MASSTLPLLKWRQSAEQLSVLTVPRVGLGLVVLAGVLARLMVAWDSIQNIVRTFMPDDAFYYFGIARHIAQGYGSTADGISLTNGYHPLWMVVLSVTYGLVGNDPNLLIHIALTTAAVLDVFTCLIVFLLVRRVTGSEPISLAAAAVYFLNPFAALDTDNGLETTIGLFFFALTIWWYVKIIDEEPSLGRRAILGLLVGLTLLSRTDYIFFALALEIELVRRLGIKTRSITYLALQNLVTLLVIAPWLVWNLANFGTVMQVSGEVYPYILHRIWFAQGGSYLSLGFVKQELAMASKVAAHLARLSGMGKALPLLVGSGVALAIFGMRGQQRKSYVSLLASFWFVFVGALLPPAFNGLWRWMVLPWYFAPWMIVLALFVGLTIPYLSLQVRKWSFLALGVLVLSYSAQYAELRQTGWFEAQANAMATGLPSIQALCTHEKFVGVTDSGYFSYYANCTVVNLDGVVNNEAFAALQNGSFISYLQAHGIHYVALNPDVRALIPDATRLQDDGMFARVPLTAGSGP